MKKVDVSQLSYDELLQLAEEAKAEAARKREDRKKEIRDQIQSLLNDNGFVLADVMNAGRGKSAGKAKGPAAAAKFADPNNPENTWTGRGRKPTWLNDALNAGASLEEFALKE